MAPAVDYLRMIAVKGYTVDELAQRWDMSSRHLYRKAKNPTQRDWDSVSGLPPKGRLNHG